ncbi:MAG TPA: CDP-alcohol phosphatidyltransferase family protein [Bryobacteraceae bacterium]|jgi:cardiolipin synthase
MTRWINLPNLLTLLRLFLVPFIVQALLSGRNLLAFALFGIAAVTDVLDGAAARHFGISTQVGAYLDPVADKCLLSGVFLAMAAARIVPWWFVGIIFGRDLYILFGVAVFILFTGIREFPPSVWGKVSTFVQILTVTFFLTTKVLEVRVLDALSPVMLWPCVVFTTWSGIHYTWRGFRVTRAH